MSNLLKEAIVDAQALKEAALKNAEAAIIDKYSDEVKQTIESLLEQDELGAVETDFGGGAFGDDPAAATEATPGAGEYKEVTEDDLPLAATDNLADEEGRNLESFPEEGEEVEFNVNLGALQEAIQELQDEVTVDEEIEISEEDIKALLDGAVSLEEEEDLEEGENPIELQIDDPAAEETADSEAMAGLANLSEDQDTQPMDESEDHHAAYAASEDGYRKCMKAGGTHEECDAKNPRFGMQQEDQDIPENLVDAVMERLKVDMAAELSGWAGRSAESTKWEMMKGLAARRDTDYVEDILEPLKKAQEELTFENKQLKQQVSQYKQALGELKETLVETNLSNGRLLYTNRVLRNTSLNERQKEKIVEAISNAGSVTEAKTIYDTLQSTVQSTPKRSPQSLSEAISRRSSVIRATRQESTATDPHLDRMQRLAGIK